jgi:hypothetical protein
MHRLKLNIVDIIALVILFGLCRMQLSAQENFNASYRNSPNLHSYNNFDSTEVNQPSSQSTISVIQKKHKSTTAAMLFSAALPGAGQFYNESYWKIPIVLGLGGYWGYEWVQMNNELKTYKSKYSESLVKFPPSGSYQYKNLRDFYRSERDKFAWYLGILYVLNIVDAYVDASLFEFSVGEDLSSVSSPRSNLSLSVKLKF